MKYIDIHCHLDFPDYGEEIGDVLDRMREVGVAGITIGTDLESSKRAVKIAEESEKTWNKIWACIGVHPAHGGVHPADNHAEVWDEEEFEKLVQSPKVVGIGECGLDFFRTKPEDLEKEKERQGNLFRKQIEFAIKYDKPLMLHCRAAYDETLDILREYKDKLKEIGEESKLRGNSHFFAGTPEQALKYVELGFSCSFTGVITFTHDYDEVIKSLPIDMIMSETDAPFVAPVPYRGKRNEPSFVIEVVKKIAEIRGEDVETVSSAIVHNAERVFGIKLVE